MKIKFLWGELSKQDMVLRDSGGKYSLNKLIKRRKVENYPMEDVSVGVFWEFS